MNYVVYLLADPESKKTYIGCTNNWARRIRQHRKEIVGGAKYTASFKGTPYCLLRVGHFSRGTACSLESVWKRAARRFRTLEGKIKCLLQIIPDLEPGHPFGERRWGRRNEVTDTPVWVERHERVLDTIDALFS